jgi:hypothetical protein
MLKHNFLSYSGKIIISLILEIVYFPIWWYSVGFFRTVKNIWRFFRGREQSLGFSVWLKNIFVPMYGQYDWAGRMISFFIRLIQIIFRGGILAFWGLICLGLLVAWLILPVLLVLAIFFQIFN